MPGKILADEKFTIKENSWLAKIAAQKLHTSAVAMVIGSTIHLHNTTTSEFLNDTRWVKHELCHLTQYKQHGTIGFIVKYLWESLKKGYYNNRFEVEARAAENE
jgi:predicted SprT family Zn-dependent metalloprotease